MAPETKLKLGVRRAPPRRWRRRLAVGFAVCALLLGAADLIFLRLTRMQPPRLSAEIMAQAERPVEIRGARAYVGPSWMGHERGLWELHLEGEPYAMGYAQGRLGNRLVSETEEYMFGEMERYVPSKLALSLIRAGVRLRYRHLLDYVPRERQEEMYGLARGLEDRHGDFLPAFHRVVYYHALHEITQRLERSPLLGCSAFAASGAATASGHLIVGRNFDFEGPEIFDRDKAVLFFRPTGKIPFASVAWAGESGVVTGINGEAIYASINAARTDDLGKDGVPVELLLREILERAHSVDEAVALVRSHPVMVPDFYLVGDGKTGEAAVIERSPTRLEVRRTGAARGDTLVLTNHALAPAFAKDAENDRLKRYLTSGTRYRRLAELLAKAHGSIDPTRALEILRDRKSAGGGALGLGNRNALDAIIATHSVVVDAAQMVMWVSVGPHLLGRFRGFDLRKELGVGPCAVEGACAQRPNPPDLPEDPLLGSEALGAFRLAQASLRAAERLAQAGELDRAGEEARKAAALEDDMPEPHKLLGELLLRGGEAAAARRELERFLALEPPYLKDVEQVKGILGTL